MASLQGQMAGGDVSHQIYAEIMNMSSSRARSERCNSAKSVSISFPASPRNRSRSETSPDNNLTSYTDSDILRSRSWRDSKLRCTSPVKTSALRRNNPLSSRSQLVSSAQPLSALGSLSTCSTLAVSTTPHSATVTRSAGASRGPTTPRRGLASNVSLTTGIQRGALQAGSTQIDRLQQEWAALEHCRAMKRASEMVQHRLNPMYRLSGSPVPLLQRYQVDDIELQRLRKMTETNRTLQHDLKRMKANTHGGMGDVSHHSQEEKALLECSSSKDFLCEQPVKPSEQDTHVQHSWSPEYIHPMYDSGNDYYCAGGDRREWGEGEGDAFNLRNRHRQGGTLRDTERTSPQNISDSDTALSPYQLSEHDREEKLNPGAARERQTQATCWAERQTGTDSCPSSHSQSPVKSLSPDSESEFLQVSQVRPVITLVRQEKPVITLVRQEKPVITLVRQEKPVITPARPEMIEILLGKHKDMGLWAAGDKQDGTRHYINSVTSPATLGDRKTAPSSHQSVQEGCTEQNTMVAKNKANTTVTKTTQRTVARNNTAHMILTKKAERIPLAMAKVHMITETDERTVARNTAPMTLTKTAGRPLAREKTYTTASETAQRTVARDKAHTKASETTRRTVARDKAHMTLTGTAQRTAVAWGEAHKTASETAPRTETRDKAHKTASETAQRTVARDKVHTKASETTRRTVARVKARTKVSETTQRTVTWGKAHMEALETAQRTVAWDKARTKVSETTQRTVTWGKAHMAALETAQRTVAWDKAHMTASETAQRTETMDKAHMTASETAPRTETRDKAHMTASETAPRTETRDKPHMTTSETAQRTVAIDGKASMSVIVTRKERKECAHEDSCEQGSTTVRQTDHRTEGVGRDKESVEVTATVLTPGRGKAGMLATDTVRRTGAKNHADMAIRGTPCSLMDMTGKATGGSATEGNISNNALYSPEDTTSKATGGQAAEGNISNNALYSPEDTTSKATGGKATDGNISNNAVYSPEDTTSNATGDKATEGNISNNALYSPEETTSNATGGIKATEGNISNNALYSPEDTTSNATGGIKATEGNISNNALYSPEDTTSNATGDKATEGNISNNALYSPEDTTSKATGGMATEGNISNNALYCPEDTTSNATRGKATEGNISNNALYSPEETTSKATGGKATEGNISNNALYSPEETTSKATGGKATEGNISNNALYSPEETTSKATGGKATEGNISNNALYSPEDTTSNATGGKATEGNISNNALCSPEETISNATGGKATEGNISNNALYSPEDTTSNATGGKATGGSATEGNIQNNALCSPQDTTGKATGGKATGGKATGGSTTEGNIQNNALCSPQDTAGKVTRGKAAEGKIQNNTTGKATRGKSTGGNATKGNIQNTTIRYSSPKEVILKKRDLFSSVQECIKSLEVVIENSRRQNKGGEATDTGREQVKPDNQEQLTSGVKSVEETEVDMVEKSEINTSEESKTGTAVWYETNMTEGCEEKFDVSDGESDKSEDDFMHNIFMSNYFRRTSDLHCPQFVESETKMDPQPIFDEHYAQFCRTTPQRDPQGGGGVPSPIEVRVQHFLMCLQAARQNRGTGAGGRPAIEFFHLQRLPRKDQGLENTSSSNCGNKPPGLSADSNAARLKVRSRRTRLGRRSSKQKEIDAHELSAQSDGANTRIADPQVPNLISSLVCVPSGQAVSGDATPSVVPANDMTCSQPVSPVLGLCDNVSISPPISLHHRSPSAVQSCVPASGGGPKTDMFEWHIMNPAHSDLDDKLLDQKEPSGTERKQLTFLTDSHGEIGPRVDRKSQDASEVVGVKPGDPSRGSRQRDGESPHDKYTGRAEKAWSDDNTVEHCQFGEEIEKCRKQVLESEWCTQPGEACHSSTTLLTTISDHSRQAQRPQSPIADFFITGTGLNSQRQVSQDGSLWFQIPQSKTDSCAQNAQTGTQSPAEVSASKKNLTDMALPHRHIVHHSIPYKSQHLQATLTGRPALMVNRPTKILPKKTVHDLEECANKDIGHTSRFERADSRAEDFPWGWSWQKEADSREVSSDGSVSSGRPRPVSCRCHSDSRKAGRTSRVSSSPTRRSPHTEFLATLLELQSGQGTDTESCSTIVGCQQSVSESDLPLDLGLFSRESASSNKSGLVAYSNQTQNLTSACSLCCTPGESRGGLFTVASTYQTEQCLPLDWGSEHGDSVDRSSTCSVRDHECLDPLRYACLNPKETHPALQYLEEPDWRAGLTKAWVKEGGHVIIAACLPELDTQEYRCTTDQSLADPFPSPNSFFGQESDGQSLTVRPEAREQPDNETCGMARKLQLVEECIDMSRDFSQRVDSLVERLGKRQEHNQADTDPHKNRGRSVNSGKQWRDNDTVSCFVTAMGEASRCLGSAQNHGSDLSTLSTGPISNDLSLSPERAGHKGSSPHTRQTIDRGSMQGSRSIISTVQAYNKGLTVCSGQNVTSGSDSPQGQTRNRYISARQTSNTSSTSPDRTASVRSSSEARKTTNKGWTCDSSSDNTARCVSRGGISQGPEADISVNISYLHNWDQTRSFPLKHKSLAVQLVSGQPSYQQKPLGDASGQKSGDFTSRHNPGPKCGVPGVESLQFCQQTDFDDCSFSVEKIVLCPPRKTSNKVAATCNTVALAPSKNWATSRFVNSVKTSAEEKCGHHLEDNKVKHTSLMKLKKRIPYWGTRNYSSVTNVGQAVTTTTHKQNSAHVAELVVSSVTALAQSNNPDTLAHLENLTSKHPASGRPVWNNNFMKGVSLNYRPRYHRPQSAGVGTASRRKINEAAGRAEFARRTRSASWGRAESVSKMTASGARSHTCTLMTSRQTQTVAKQRSLHTLTPKKSSKRSIPRKNSKQSIPRNASKQLTPRKRSKQSTHIKNSKESIPMKSSNQSISRQSSNQLTSRQSSHQSTSRQSSIQSISRQSSTQSIYWQSSHQSTARQSSNQSVSRQNSKQSTFRQSSNKSTSKQSSHQSISMQNSNQSVSGQSSNQSVSGESSNESTSRQSSKQSTFRQSSKLSTPRQSSNQPTPRQSSNQSTPRQSSKQSTPRQSSKQSTPRQSSKQSTPRQSSNQSKQMTRKQSSKLLTPRQNSKQITPRQSSRQITPRQSSRQVSPRQNSKQMTPRQSSRHITPGQSSQKLTPRQSSRQISPRQSKIKLTHRQSSGEIIERQSSTETLQTAAEGNKNQSGAHTEQAANPNTCCQRKERKAQRTQSVSSSQRELNVGRQIDRSVKTRKATRSSHSLSSSHRLRDPSSRVSTPRDESVSPSLKTVGKGPRQCRKKQGRGDGETLCDRIVEEPQSQYSRLMSDPALGELSPQSLADTSPPISARQDGSTDSSRFQTETQAGARAQPWTQFQRQIPAEETPPKTATDKEEQNRDLLCEVYQTSTTKKCKSRNKGRRLLSKCKRDEKEKPGGTAVDIEEKVIFSVSVVKRRPASEDPGTRLDEAHASLTNELSQDQNGLDERHGSFNDELFSDQNGAAEKQTGIPHNLLDDVQGYTWSGRQTGLVLDARHAIVSGIDYNKPTYINNMRPTDSNYWKPANLHIHREEAKRSQEPDNTCDTRKREDHDLVCGAQGDDPYLALNKRGDDHELAGVKRDDDLDFAGMERCDNLDFAWPERDCDFPLAGFERCDNLDFTGVDIVDDLDFAEVETSDNYDSSCVEAARGQEEHWDDESELDSTGSDVSPLQTGNPMRTLLEEINDHFEHLIQPKTNRTETSQEDLVTPCHVETETKHNTKLFKRDRKRLLAIISPGSKLNKSVQSSADMTSSIGSRVVRSSGTSYGYKPVLLRKEISELPSREARNRTAKSSAVSASQRPLSRPCLLTSRKPSQSKRTVSLCHISPSVKHECSTDHCDIDFLHPVTVPPPLLGHRGDVNSAEDFLSDTCHNTKPSCSLQALSTPQHEIPMTAAEDKQLQGARYYDDAWHWRGQCLMSKRQSRVSQARQRMISAVLQPLAGGPSPSRSETQSYGQQLLPQLKRSLVHPSYGIVGKPAGTHTPS